MSWLWLPPVCGAVTRTRAQEEAENGLMLRTSVPGHPDPNQWELVESHEAPGPFCSCACLAQGLEVGH